jgi:hypothetical protein
VTMQSALAVNSTISNVLNAKSPGICRLTCWTNPISPAFSLNR